MLLFTKKIIISAHAKNRYRERIKDVPFSEIRKGILQDFSVSRVRRKTPKNEKNEFKVWCHGSRLYSCVETEKTIVVKTVIQMLPKDEEKIKKEIYG